MKKVNYTNFNCQEKGNTFIQGIRGVENSDKVYIAGSLVESATLTYGLLYEGPLNFNGVEGKWNKIMFPGDNVINTSCYGPNNSENGIQIVGSYKLEGDSRTLGFFYEGPTDGSGTWEQVSANPDAKMTFVHSIMGGYAVGNYDTEYSNAYAFIYDINTKEFLEIKADGAYSTTLYGIWYNGGTSYTLAGGCSFEGPTKLSQAFIVDWDSNTKETSNWKFYQHLGLDVANIVTHFEGITSDGSGGYNLPSDVVDIESFGGIGAAFVNISRNEDGTFGEANWKKLKFPLSQALWTSANTSFKNNILGVYLLPNNEGGNYTISYNAEVI